MLTSSSAADGHQSLTDKLTSAARARAVCDGAQSTSESQMPCPLRDSVAEAAALQKETSMTFRGGRGAWARRPGQKPKATMVPHHESAPDVPDVLFDRHLAFEALADEPGFTAQEGVGAAQELLVEPNPPASSLFKDWPGSLPGILDLQLPLVISHFHH